MIWRLVLLLVASVALLACGHASAPPPVLSREDAIQRAIADANRSWPEFLPVETRVDSATAELVTLGEANRRLGRDGAVHYGAGYGVSTPVWWVRLRGEFRYAASVAGRVEIAAERQMVYDARTGGFLGGRISPPVP